MNIRNSFRGLGFCLSGFLLAMANAGACPDCTLVNSGGVIEPSTVMSKIAFSISTLLLMSIVFSVIGLMIWAMVKACRDVNLHKESPLSSVEGV